MSLTRTEFIPGNPIRLPGHGFVRIQPWELASSSEDDAGVKLKLNLAVTAESRLLWLHAIHLVFPGEKECRKTRQSPPDKASGFASGQGKK